MFIIKFMVFDRDIRLNVIESVHCRHSYQYQWKHKIVKYKILKDWLYVQRTNINKTRKNFPNVYLDIKNRKYSIEITACNFSSNIVIKVILDKTNIMFLIKVSCGHYQLTTWILKDVRWNSNYGNVEENKLLWRLLIQS